MKQLAKTVVLIIGLALCCHNVSGQKWNAGITVGTIYQNNLKQLSGYYTEQNIIKPTFGIFLARKIYNGISICFDSQYFSLSNLKYGSHSNYETDYHRIITNLSSRYNFSLSNKLTIYPHLGLSIQHGVTNQKYIGANPRPYSSYSLIGVDFLARPFVGCGTSYNLNKRMNALAELSFKPSFRTNTHYVQAQMGLGLLF